MSDQDFDLFASARQEMIDDGFHPDFPPGVIGVFLKLVEYRLMMLECMASCLRPERACSASDVKFQDFDLGETSCD